MKSDAEEEQLLRSTALQTSKSILLARQRAEQELLQAKKALEIRTEELAHSLSMMSATLESTTDAIVATDQNGRITGFNHKLVEIWGIPDGTLRSSEPDELRELISRQFKDPKAFRTRVEDIYATSPAESFDVLETLDGRAFERYSKIQSIDGRNVGRVWSFREITERKRAEAERERLLLSEREARERAERETRMKDDFLATLSHELRTPLNAILGWANVLRSTDKAEEIAEGLQVIERNARAQTQIIDDLLDMSRIISGNVRLDVQRVDLIPVVKAAMESVKPMAAAKEIRLTSVLDPVAGPISGDPARLQQVLYNLLVNALKFTSRGGRVQIILERVNSHVEISVSDTGQGITADFLPHVFDRFRQADASSTRQQRGLGLGLAIVKNLAELHGGGVRAKSPGPGQGSTFTVVLPVVLAKIESELDRRHPHSGGAGSDGFDENPDLTGVRILAVDDEADARELVKRILTVCGATVETAGCAEDALVLLKRIKPHVLITDIGMPGEDGYAVIRRVRQLGADQGGAIPAIALTAFARSEDRKRAILNGFQMHMAKPVEPSELVTMVASLSRSSR